MADFELDITRWVEKVKARTKVAPRAIAEAFVERLKELTPVKTGRLRAGWQVEEVGKNEIAVTNGVEYARRINDGFIGEDSLGRRYDQPGHHMVEQAIAEADQITRKVLDKL